MLGCLSKEASLTRFGVILLVVTGVCPPVVVLLENEEEVDPEAEVNEGCDVEDMDVDVDEDNTGFNEATAVADDVVDADEDEAWVLLEEVEVPYDEVG